MQEINKKNLIRKLLPLVFLSVFYFAPSVMATAADDAIVGLNETAKKSYTGNVTGDLTQAGIVQDLPSAIGKIIGAALSLIGIAFLILMIYGGFTWMLARGNEQDVTKAKDLIQAAVIGIIIVFAAYAITKFVGQQLF